MNTDYSNTAVSSPAASPHRPQASIADVLARWQVKKHTYKIADALHGYALVLVALLIVLLIAATVLFVGARDLFFESSFDNCADLFFGCFNAKSL